MDRPRVANAYAAAGAWFYDQLTITVAGAPRGQDALTHASVLGLGSYSQVFHNLKGPADGYALSPGGIMNFALGASRSPAVTLPGGANDLGALAVTATFNSGVLGYDAVGSRSNESGGREFMVGDPLNTR